MRLVCLGDSCMLASACICICRSRIPVDDYSINRYMFLYPTVLYVINMHLDGLIGFYDNKP